MGNAKFTPGPWAAVRMVAPMSRSKDGIVWGILAMDPMRGRIDSQIEGISEPNARLIAAAPDLLTELKAAVANLTMAMLLMDSDTRQVAMECIKAHKAVIAKAEEQ